MGVQATWTMVLALVLGSVPACRKAPPAGASAPLASASASASAAVASSPSAPEPPRRFEPEVEKKLYAGKCPSWVHGARTRIEDDGDGLRVIITAETEAAVAEIRSRARYLAGGKYKGGDGLGRCPVPRDSVTEVVDVEGGARLNVHATPDLPPDRLRRLARARIAAIPGN
jgi:hypothetical protein